MKRMKWSGLLVAAAAATVAVGAFLSSAFAAGTGPTITLDGGGTYVIGSPVNAVLTVDASPDGHKGYNMGLVYSTASLTANTFTDNSVGTGVYASVFCPPASLTDSISGALVLPLAAVIGGCAGLTGVPSTAAGTLATVNFTTIAVGVTAVHMTTLADLGPLFGTFGTYTVDDATTTPQTNLYACADGGAFVLALGYCGPLPTPGSTAADIVINIINPPPDMSLTKVASAASTVAGQPISFTLTVNNPSGTTTATNVVITDTLDAAYPGANVTFSGTDAADCGIAGQVVTCGPTSIAPGGTWTANIDVSATDSNAGGQSPNNCATVTIAESDPNSANNTGCDVVQIIAPAVVWEKSPTQEILWLAENCDNLVDPQCLNEAVNSFTFQEILVNAGDPNGLGAFQFDLHYDPQQYNTPVIDMSPAIALFAADGRTLDCSMTIQFLGLIRVACASTGPFGVGPIFVGAQVMANVTLTPQEFLVEAIRPNKENGDISVVKDDQVLVKNTCGQPLNDGTIQPIPGQPECQGVPLQGVGPGGLLNVSKSVQTIRRLEGDIDKDCDVDVTDMQIEASKFGSAVGSLLYHVFYDVNSPFAGGDGRIDINDVQFVYGRFGSTCVVPIPTQPALPEP